VVVGPRSLQVPPAAAGEARQVAWDPMGRSGPLPGTPWVGRVPPTPATPGWRRQHPPTHAPLPAGGLTTVDVTLLPLRPGVQRLPAFLVVSEVDGRPLDSVHDVLVLVQ